MAGVRWRKAWRLHTGLIGRLTPSNPPPIDLINTDNGPNALRYFRVVSQGHGNRMYCQAVN